MRVNHMLCICDFYSNTSALSLYLRGRMSGRGIIYKKIYFCLRSVNIFILLKIINSLSPYLLWKPLKDKFRSLSWPPLWEFWKVAKSSWKSAANAILMFKYVTMLYGPRALKAAQRAQVRPHNDEFMRGDKLASIKRLCLDISHWS